MAPPDNVSQALAAQGWRVQRISQRIVMLTKAGSVLFASSRRKHRANTLERVAAVDDFITKYPRDHRLGPLAMTLRPTPKGER
jgi:hypothetical protein